MWELSIPAWEFVVRGATIYFALMILIRVSGKRTVGEFTPFDMLVVLLIGEAAQGGLTGGDDSIVGSLIVCATLLGLNFAIAFLSARSKTFDKIVEGEPVVLVRNGQLFKRALLRSNLPESDLDEAIREHGAKNRSEVALAMLETNGQISIVKREETDGNA